MCDYNHLHASSSSGIAKLNMHDAFPHITHGNDICSRPKTRTNQCVFQGMFPVHHTHTATVMNHVDGASYMGIQTMVNLRYTPNLQ